MFVLNSIKHCKLVFELQLLLVTLSLQASELRGEAAAANAEATPIMYNSYNHRIYVIAVYMYI